MIHASLLTLKARLSSQRTILLVGFLVGILALGTGLRDRNSERGDPEVAKKCGRVFPGCEERLSLRRLEFFGENFRHRSGN